jgi:hypothetical protein
MKYELETIPVWDAYERGVDCPLCFLKEKAEADYVNFFLGNSVMIPEIRVEVNENGFCPRHYGMMFRGKNKLGLALLTKTHMDQRVKGVAEALSGVEKAAAGGGLSGAIFKRDAKAAAARLTADLAEKEAACGVCAKLENTVSNYTFTVVHLYKKNSDFPEALRSSTGFCLHHLPRVVTMAVSHLAATQLAEFCRDLRGCLTSHSGALGDGLNKFTEKFDYHNANAPLAPEAKDALPRSIHALTGNFEVNPATTTPRAST